MSEKKFKVGDKVRMLNNCWDGHFKIGDILTIQRLGPLFKDDYQTYYCEEMHKFNGPKYIGENDSCELVEEKEFITPNQMLKEPMPEFTDLLPKQTGTKNDSSKPDLSLIPTDALLGMGAALTYGAKKYNRHNFREGIAFSRLVAATMRHLSAFNEGENLDRESGLSHLDHAIASLAMLKFMDVNRQDMDDRWLNPIHQKDESKPGTKISGMTPEEIQDLAETLQNRGR